MSLLYGGGILPNVYDAYRMKKAKEGTLIADSVVNNIVAIQNTALPDSETYKSLGRLVQKIRTNKLTVNSVTTDSYKGVPTGSYQLNVHNYNTNLDDNGDDDGDDDDGIGVGVAAVEPRREIVRINTRRTGETVRLRNPKKLTNRFVVDELRTDRQQKRTNRYLTEEELDKVLHAFRHGNGNDKLKVMRQVLISARTRSPQYTGNVSRRLTHEVLKNVHLERFNKVAALGSL